MCGLFSFGKRLKQWKVPLFGVGYKHTSGPTKKSEPVSFYEKMDIETHDLVMQKLTSGIFCLSPPFFSNTGVCDQTW
jgi:hypothetical protein